MPRYKLTVEYDGGGFSGWQRQQHAPSIQQALEEAFQRYCGQLCEIVCAGRTDAGVHARGQVAHVDLPEERSPYSIQQGVNFHLDTPQIALTAVTQAAADFHARFDATGRRYLYRIVNRSAALALDLGRAWHVPDRDLDAEAMHAAAQSLLGHHDFTSFRDTQCQAKSPMKTLDRFDILRQGELIEMHLEARSFLHHQVRIMAGSLRLIGNGKWRVEDLQQALAARDRSAAGETAPPDGLYLMEVKY